MVTAERRYTESSMLPAPDSESTRQHAVRRRERQKVAHVLRTELARMPAPEMNYELANPMDVRPDCSFAVPLLTRAPAHLLQQPKAPFGVGRRDEVRVRNEHAPTFAPGRRVARTNSPLLQAQRCAWG